jgi:hypothetical protein
MAFTNSLIHNRFLIYSPTPGWTQAVQVKIFFFNVQGPKISAKTCHHDPSDPWGHTTPAQMLRDAQRFTRLTRRAVMDALPGNASVASSRIAGHCRFSKTSRDQAHLLPPNKPRNKSDATACDMRSQTICPPDAPSFADANPPKTQSKNLRQLQTEARKRRT